MGNDINNLIAKLTPTDAKKFESLPINAILTGNFKNPNISTDMKQATTTLVNNLVKQQKDRLVQQGTTALGNIIKNNTKPKDTTKTPTTTTPKEDIKTKANSVLKDLFNKKKKEAPKPATTTPTPTP